VKIFGFHLMPYQGLPADHLESMDSSWVTLSNAMYDPALGHALYERYIGELVAYDRAGFDGVCVNEHHQSPYGMMPSPNVIAGVLIPQTTCQIAILGNALPLRDHPLRIAEEVAMLDVISGGRIISGFVRGIGAEYHPFGMDPTASRTRFYEAHDLIVAAWTRPGPFEWYGTHYKLRYVNPWPRPLQRPHPPIWSPSQGSGETVDWAARNRYTYLQTYSDIGTVRRVFDGVRAAADGYGYSLPPAQLGWALPVFVADTDAAAEAIALPALDTLFNKLMRMPKDLFFPAGYVSRASAARILATKGGLGSGATDVRDLIERGYAVVGSPAAVRSRLEQYQKDLGFGVLCPLFQFGDLAPDYFAASLTLFAQQVMPALRPLGEP